MDCSSLKSVTLPRSTRQIKKWAFRNCEKIEYIVIPKSVTDIPDEIFTGCPDEMIVYVEKGSYAETHCLDEEFLFDEQVRYLDGSQMEAEEETEEAEGAAASDLFDD